MRDRWRNEQRVKVWERCRGVCESTGCTMAAREWAHCFGRRHIIAEPLASHKTMTCGLCVAHHHEMDRDPASNLALVQKLRALVRATEFFGVGDFDVAGYVDADDANGAARAIEDALKSSGEWERLLEAAGR